MRILFMGTPEFAAVSLKHLIVNNFEICGVVTQPDRPKGRGMALRASPVKLLAIQNGLPVWQPQRVAETDFLKVFEELKPDLAVVVAFGQKIPPQILYGPRYGCINVHASLLPKYRGADPIRAVLLNGETTTGITTMYLNEGWDTGDIIFQEETAIAAAENYAGLYCRLAELGGQVLIRTLKAIEAGNAPRIPQDDRFATIAPKIKPEEYCIDWGEPAAKIHNLVRALAPQPGAETFFRCERFKILETKISDSDDEAGNSDGCGPGGILKVVKNQGLLVATGDRPLLITKIQPAGKKAMSAFDCANGRCIKPGMRLCREMEINL
ncbi:MAG: methionyl-tRNA formyltransferase [Firmicutes bacterium]|nr:methionyl-tRNA formyltransferase [Bacillota bacterium]